MLNTYSGHRTLPEPARPSLLACVAALADGRYGGQIVKRHQVAWAIRWGRTIHR
ncbi:hypothetical protein ABH927_000636 [Planotetraspora sp. GP83]